MNQWLESIANGQTSDRKSIARRIRVRAGNAAFPQRGVADYFYAGAYQARSIQASVEKGKTLIFFGEGGVRVDK